jgi:ATP-dependent Clp protease ATP-binding subunit ClpC
MRLGFTDTMTAAVREAEEEARRLGQETVGAEHLLLGILDQKSGEAMRTLASAVNVTQLRRLLDKKLPHAAEPSMVTGRLSFSPLTQEAINSAISAAQAAGMAKVSTRFVLAALLEDPPLAVVESLRAAGADLDDLATQLRRPADDEEV